MAISKVKEQILSKQTLTDKSNLKDYGKEFQVKVIKLIINDKSFAFEILPILKREYFSDIYVRGVYEVSVNYLEKYNRTPSIDNLNVLIQDTFENIKPYQLVLKSLEVVNLEDREFIIENIKSFCFKKHAETELAKIEKYIKEGKFDIAQTLSFDLFKFNTNNSTKIYSLKEDYEIVFDENKVINPQPLVFPTFNKYMQGGPGAGKLVIAVAGSNFGKTNYLVAQARKLNEQGKKVALFTFEIGSSEIFRRHIAGLTDTKQAEISSAKEKATKKILSDEMGDFVLVEEKATKAKMSTITHNLNYLKSQGFFPDMILVDSLNQLKLPEGMRYEGDNRMFEYLAEELRDLAKDEGIPVITVFQGNRCLAPETIVNIKGKGNVEIKDVTEGDMIETPYGFKKINHKWENKSQPMYKIKLKNGKEIICSSRHEFPTKNGLLSIEEGLSKNTKIYCKFETQ